MGTLIRFRRVLHTIWNDQSVWSEGYPLVHNGKLYCLHQTDNRHWRIYDYLTGQPYRDVTIQSQDNPCREAIAALTTWKFKGTPPGEKEINTVRKRDKAAWCLARLGV